MCVLGLRKRRFRQKKRPKITSFLLKKYRRYLILRIRYSRLFAAVMLPNWVHTYSKSHRMAKHRGTSLAKLGTTQGSITWQNPLNGKSHWDIHGKSHGTKIILLNVWWRQHQYTFLTAIMIFWGPIHTSFWITLVTLDKNGSLGKSAAFLKEHTLRIRLKLLNMS